MEKLKTRAENQEVVGESRRWVGGLCGKELCGRRVEPGGVKISSQSGLQIMFKTLLNNLMRHSSHILKKKK